MFVVVGGSGFIGTRLVKSLIRENIKVSLIDKKKSIEFPEITSIADVQRLNELLDTDARGKILVNLAAEHRDNVTPVSLYHDVNVKGASNVCQFAVEREISTIIFTSSVAVYGFAERGTDESGQIRPFNAYGETKYEAEKIYMEWQKADQQKRRLIIIRPTVVFGEDNRGNVYNLFKQIHERKFLMVGSGKNIKSMAYVENLASFIKFSSTLNEGVHIFNYVDKPDFSMEELAKIVEEPLGIRRRSRIKIPKYVGVIIGIFFDLIGRLLNKEFPISKLRILKFCADSVYRSKVLQTDFKAPVTMEEAIRRTLKYEFPKSR